MESFTKNLFSKTTNTPGSSLEEKKLNGGIDIVFEHHPELRSIGTKEQYAEYLNTIFPESKVKDVVWHGSKIKNIREFYEFTHLGTKASAEHRAKRKSEWNLDKVTSFLLPIAGGRLSNFIEQNSLLSKFIKGKEYYYPAVINLNNIKSKKDEYSYFTNALLQDKEQGYDGYEYINELEDAGSKSYVVFEPKNIHILGTDQDAQDFKKFVQKQVTANDSRASS